MEKKICLIIGHGGNDVGAINPVSRETELAYNQELAPIIADILTQNGYKVDIYNRGYRKVESIYELNKGKYDIIVSLHCNAYNTQGNGTEVLYWNTSKNGKNLAENLQKEILSALALKDRGLKSIDIGNRGAYLLKKTNAPCVIIEPFFIDNELDFLIGKTKKLEYANAVVKGINNYFGKETKTETIV